MSTIFNEEHRSLILDTFKNALQRGHALFFLDQGLNGQWFPLLRGKMQLNGFYLAMPDAHAAPHAILIRNEGVLLFHADRLKRAQVSTHSTGDTQILIHLGHIP